MEKILDDKTVVIFMIPESVNEASSRDRIRKFSSDHDKGLVQSHDDASFTSSI